ncbi:MAG: hypothetical protein AAFV96_01520 [Pseudomonadota bacterium]
MITVGILFGTPPLVFALLALPRDGWPSFVGGALAVLLTCFVMFWSLTAYDPLAILHTWMAWTISFFVAGCLVRVFRWILLC